MRLLGLDVGDVKIGVAVCDSLEIAAFPVGLVRRAGSLKRDVAAVAALAAEQEAEGVVIGLPLSLDGEIGRRRKRRRDLPKRWRTCFLCRSSCGTKAYPASRPKRF